jgi:excisionase family DNA binding protein
MMQAAQTAAGQAPRKHQRHSPSIALNEAPSLPRTYSQDHVLKMLGVAKRTIQRWVNERGFPKTKELGAHTRVYLADEVDAWISKRLK